jgi:hypothetical protein
VSNPDFAIHGTAIRRGQLAIREAVARFQASFFPVADVDRAYVACTEATMWIQRLDGLIEMTDASYRKRRDADAQGRVVGGLRWARNRHVHDVAAIFVVSPARHLPGVSRAFNEPFYGAKMEAKWRLRSEVPPEVGYRKDERAEKAYDLYVAGQSIEATLADAAAFLWERAAPLGLLDSFPDWA